MKHFLSFAEQLARFGGTVAKQSIKKVNVMHKDGDVRNVVSDIDYEISNLIKANILKEYPDHVFYSEETPISDWTSSYAWVIDPIDGTSNYVRGLPHYCVSVTLLIDGVVEVGVVYAPATDECFTFSKNEGTDCNGQSVHTSQVVTLSDAYVNFHPGRRADDVRWAAETKAHLLINARKSINLASSALDLCYLASGRTDVVIYGTLTTLDVAGAITMVRAAGGEVYDYATLAPVAISSEPQRIIATATPALLNDYFLVRPM